MLKNVYDINEGIIGILFLPITVSVILGSMIYKRISKKYEGTTILKFSLGGLSIAILLFGLFNTLNLIVLSVMIFILGIFVGITPALLSTLISQRFESIKGKVLGVFNFIRYMGMTIGAIFIGVIVPIFIPYYFILTSLILILIFIYTRTELFNIAMNMKE